MPAFTAEVPHSLGKEGAHERLKSFLETISEKYKGQISDLDGSWEDDTLNFRFSTFGIKVAGALTVEDDKVVMKGELPFSAMMFKGKIVGGIQEAIEKELA